MNAQRMIGFVLLVSGICLIAYALGSSFQIFTGKIEAPVLFKADQKMPAQKTTSGQEELFARQIEGVLENQLQGMIPSNALPRALNLLGWSLFASLLVFGGSQTASLGIKLLKQ